MAKLPTVTSPQFRSQLIRKLRNVIPDCTPEFVEGLERGIGFRLKDRYGRLRSNVVRIYRNGPGVLTETNLVRAVWAAGRPPSGLPKNVERSI